MSEDLVLEEDLLDHLLRAPDEVRAAFRRGGVVVLAQHRRPAALAADPVHHRRHRRERLVQRLLRGLGDVAVRVDAQRGLGIVPGPARRPPVDLRERRKPLRHAADDRQRHRQSEQPRARGRVRIAADRDPDGDLPLRARVHGHPVERRPVLPGPGDALVLAQAQQQLELLREQRVVVVEVVPEQRERLDERAASGHDLRAAVREQVERRELLEDADGIVRAQDGDGACQADLRRPLGDRREHDGRGGDGEVGPVVLAHAEDVESELVGELRFLQQVAQAGRWVGVRPVRQLRERVDAELHGGLESAPCGTFWNGTTAR